MKRKATPSSRLCVLLLVALSLALICLLCSLPWISFSSALYSKRSPNTFVGDETYLRVLAEVEERQAGYRAQGLESELRVETIERVNSKGVTTSLCVFTLSSSSIRTGWELLRAQLRASWLLRGILVLLALSWGLALLALARGKQASRLGSVSFACALVAFFLVPVIFLSLNRSLSRWVDLYTAGTPPAGIGSLLPALDAFLFGGTAGENLDALLSSLAYTLRPPVFLMLIPAFLSVCAGILSGGRSLKKVLGRVLLYFSVISFSLFILYPFFVMFITAFRSNAETTDMHFLHILPVKWMFSNLKGALDRGVLRYLLNSLFIAGGATLVAMLCGIPAAYAMARMEFRGRKIYLGFVIMSQMFSPVVLLVGISRLMNTLGLNNTLWGLMFINAAFNQAFAVWLLRGTFLSISSEMEQAACIDGCTVVGALVRILLPMAAPGIVTTLIFVFINAWNEYTISTVLISTESLKPITVGITKFSSFNMIEWQYLFAAALLATVPVVILFMLIEKHLASGLTAGGVKG